MIRVQEPDLGKAEVDALIQCIAAGDASGNSQTVEQFEQAFAATLEVPYAVAVSSGSAALHVAFASLGFDYRTENAF